MGMQAAESDGFDVDRPTALRLISESLTLAERLGAEPIRCRGVCLLDGGTLVVEILAESTDATALRGEIANVMGALSGLDVPGLYPVLEVRSFGVRAFDQHDEEILWVLSSVEAAGFVGRGQPIEWLNRSFVQENTPQHRRAQADRLIGQVELAWRDLMDYHARCRCGDEYLNELWPAAEVGKLRRAAAREGVGTENPRTLLDYAYLPQLGGAIQEHADWFDDGCIPVAQDLGQLLRGLNEVRRKVAHHRLVSGDDLSTCRDVAAAILEKVGHAHPNLSEDFLVDRWEARANEIIHEALAVVRSVEEPQSGTMPEGERRRLVVQSMRTQLSASEAAIEDLASLVVPAQRRALHDLAVAALARWRVGLKDLIEVAARFDVTVHEATAAAEKYQQALDGVQEFSRRIAAIRADMPGTE